MSNANLIHSLLARAQYALERGWTGAAMDALGRAGSISAQLDPPIAHVTVQRVTDEQRKARSSPKVTVEIWRVSREHPQ